MLLKLIVCQVPRQSRARFSRGQEYWAALRDVEGFAGQTGGWSDAPAPEAVIIGLWRDEGSYDRFMHHAHDPIFESGGQKGTYESSSVKVWHHLFDILGSCADMQAAMERAGLLRIARCQLRNDRHEHFIDVQQSIWNPGMVGAGKMLAGVFCHSRRDEDQFLVCTLWRSETDHRHYVEQVFPELRRRAEVERDCASITGWIVALEPMWTVTPQSGGRRPPEFP